jgi:hypothetical protein
MVATFLSSLNSYLQPYKRRGELVTALLGALVLQGCTSSTTGLPSPAAPADATSAPAECPAPVDKPVNSLENVDLPSFRRYAVSEYFQGAPADIDPASHPDAARFTDRLAPALEQGPNFAGYYRLVSWGCGTHCTASLIVDLRSGAVHDGVVAELDLHFQVDSALLIVNARPEKYFEVGEVPPWAGTRYYRWHQGRLELLGPHFRPPL